MRKQLRVTRCLQPKPCSTASTKKSQCMAAGPPTTPKETVPGRLPIPCAPRGGLRGGLLLLRCFGLPGSLAPLPPRFALSAARAASVAAAVGLWSPLLCSRGTWGFQPPVDTPPWARTGAARLGDVGGLVVMSLAALAPLMASTWGVKPAVLKMLKSCPSVRRRGYSRAWRGQFPALYSLTSSSSRASRSTTGPELLGTTREARRRDTAPSRSVGTCTLKRLPMRSYTACTGSRVP
mmetsp:Transcript_27989/g.61420  ORF Transcript_27989/g.61420 Transcript_27989/m.61420 type:complete len:236 (+) Transcript_27989:134-841(+)